MKFTKRSYSEKQREQFNHVIKSLHVLKKEEAKSKEEAIPYLRAIENYTTHCMKG